MSVSQHSGEPQRSNESPQRAQIVLIAGCFAFNHSPECLLELSLRKDSLTLNPVVSPPFACPNTLPITPQLAYRINVHTIGGSENSCWFLQLKAGEVELKLKSVDFKDLETWKDILRKHVNKFGFWEDFKPLRRISKGVASAVYEVVRATDNRRFAVKAFPKAQYQENQSLLDSLEKEIRMLREVKELKHEHLLGIEQVYHSDNSYYLIMELCGKDLLRGGRGVEGSRGAKIRSAMRQLLCGLAALHERGVVHRDIKPNNIMFKAEGQFQLVITDFGLATHLKEEHPFVRCGTPGFVAPEVFELQSNETLGDSASDIFSLGAVFHLLLTGKYLFASDNSKQVLHKNSKMDFDLGHDFYQKFDSTSMDLLRKMLTVNPKERITAREALQHQFLIDEQAKLRSPALTFQTYNQFIPNNEEQEFSQIELGVGRKRHHGEYRKSSHE